MASPPPKPPQPAPLQPAPPQPAPPQPAPGTAGCDLGASLAKLIFHAGGSLDGLVRARFSAADLPGVRRFLAARRPRLIGATGGGAVRLAESFRAESPDGGVEVVVVPEFAAWARGAALVAAAAGIRLPEEFLLVSLGTGTSVLLIRGQECRRVGGTALGGGTLAGLGSLLAPGLRISDLVEAADRGDRRRVDLLVGDVYRRSGAEPDSKQRNPVDLDPDLNAASFGKLALPSGGPASELAAAAAPVEASTARPSAGEPPAEPPQPEDLAHALVGLVGENVALLATALAREHGVSTVVYCGSPVEASQELARILTWTTETFGAAARTLPHGAYCGALGAAALVGD